MKKFILCFIGMLAIPCILTLGFSIFSENIQIGKGGNSLSGKYMGKEILIELNGLYKSMDVEEYVLGVLCGTVPPDYDTEALKVQAVLIRTNVLKEMEEKNTADAADLSYRYLTVENRIELWGDRNYEKNEMRMEKAVARTAGQVLKKEDSLIMALYHEVSIGKTAGAEEILGENISYLQSVESSQDVEARHYMNIVNYTWEEINVCLKTAAEKNAGAQSADAESDATVQKTQDKTVETSAGTVQGKEQAGEGVSDKDLSKTSGKRTKKKKKKETEGQTENQQTAEDSIVEVKIEESSENGFVKRVSVNGNIYTGEEAMEMFNLASTNFYVEEIDGGIRFVCLGKGNCLGVSQYGANYMALQGKKMEEILKYYYTDVSLVKYVK